MEGFEHGDALPRVSQYLDKLDIDALFAKIKEVHQEIIRQSDFSANVVTISPMAPKSPKDAAAHRTAAEEFFKATEYEKALVEATKSIAFAETDSQNLIDAYCFRAEILKKLDSLESCYEDLGHAIEVPEFPTDLTSVCREVQEALSYKIRVGRKKTYDLDWRKFRPFEVPHDLANDWQISPKLTWKKKKGKEIQIVATKDIQPGEILFVDRFFVTRLDDSKRYTHCSLCLSECDNLIPCDTCSLEMYCSTKCKSVAYVSYHKTECRFTRYYYKLKRKLDEGTQLAARAFLIDTEQGNKLPHVDNLMNTFVPQFVPSSFKEYSRGLGTRKRVRRIQNIMDHVPAAVETLILLVRSRAIRIPRAVMLYGLTASFDFRYTLILIKHFVNIEIERWKDLEMSIPDESSFREGTPNEYANDVIPEVIGYGISPDRAGLMKSSCPNTSFFIQNRQQFVFATRTILANEKLSMDVRKHPFTHWMSEEFHSWPTDYSKLEFVTSPSRQEQVEKLKQKTENMLEKNSTPLSNKEILGLVIEHCTLLCAITKKSSSGIVLCEHLLVLTMKIVYCDWYRQYKDFQLQNYLKKEMKRINNFYDLYLNFRTGCNRMEVD